mgnify:FL=1|jgi:hypothetical protein
MQFTAFEKAVFACIGIELVLALLLGTINGSVLGGLMWSVILFGPASLWLFPALRDHFAGKAEPI